MNCIHGIDARFCANCNRAAGLRAPRALGAVSLEDVLRFVNAERVRATSGAVAEVLGVNARSLETLLGKRRPEASWIVNAATDLPAGYSQDEWHPALLESSDIITTGRTLLLRMAKWKARRPDAG